MKSRKATDYAILGAVLGATAFGVCGIALADETTDAQPMSDNGMSDNGQPQSLSKDLERFEDNSGSYTNSTAGEMRDDNDDAMQAAEPAQRSERQKNLEEDVHDYYDENDSVENKARKQADSEPYSRSEKSRELSNDLEQFEQNRGSYTEGTDDGDVSKGGDTSSEMDSMEQDAGEQ